MKCRATVWSVILIVSLTLNGTCPARSSGDQLSAASGGMTEKVVPKSAKSPLSPTASAIPSFGPGAPATKKGTASKDSMGGYGTTPPLMTAKKKMTMAKDEEEIRKMLLIATRLEKLMKEAREWEQKQPSDSEKGSLKRIYQRAENFAIERQTRKKLETDVQELIVTLHSFVAKRQEELRRAQMAQELARKIAGEQKERVHSIHPQAEDGIRFEMNAPEEENVIKPDNFEIFEVHKPMTVREISALPEVYGDANNWQMLYNANQNKIPNADAKIPMGEELIVPRPKPPRDFIQEFSNE